MVPAESRRLSMERKRLIASFIERLRAVFGVERARP
jgi:hypothetical protein